ncbi:HPr kinase/phosphorylase [Microvirga tunisiensis]|uniref:Serine/threonine protein kinase n=1 Tax=Microvirga tunisiensis TaxID=2108360 RepID=A0A5N7ME42_9HYPH|nr:serine/threonine protein kinase [Microvirga tunisiensis]MPR06049.1 serine/threonine protein kinase [Microvirga tunisiensis]MPR24384.1 serine/threonine protein kinase [Microvirga tunisiensis]
MNAHETIHAGCVLIGEAGLLIRGASGSGKSALAREVVSLALGTGRFGRLVSDDRTRLEAHHGRLLARPVEPLGGSIEVFGLGIVRRPFEAAAVVRLVLDLSDAPARYPEEQDRHVVLCGVMIPRIRMQAGAISADVALGCLSGVCDTIVTL